MKTLMPIVLLAFMASSCFVEHVERRVDPRDRLVGDYGVEEYSATYHDYTYYDIWISKAGRYEEIYLNNFYGVGISVRAYVEYDRITIPFQIIDGYEIEGVGTFHGYELDLSYSVRDRYSNSRTDFCETVAWFE